MAGMMSVVMDGVEYKVRVRADNPLTERFELRDGPNAMTMLDGSEELLAQAEAFRAEL